MPPERVKEFITFVSTHCRKCQAPLPAEPGPHDPAPTRFQVAELPPIQAEITEYQGHARTCPCCGEITQAVIPADCRAHGCGPRLTATLAYLTGRHHLPKRATEEIGENVFAVSIALGTIAALEREVSTALAPAHAEALTAVKEAAVKNVDETSWKEGGQKRWLWVAATSTVAAFVIHGTRGLAGLAVLLSDTIHGILCSDRWSVYAAGRCCCGRSAGPISNAISRSVWIVAARVHLWVKKGCEWCVGSSRRGTCSVAGGCRVPNCNSDSVRARHLRQVLDAGRACADSKVVNFCSNLVDLEPALWRFVITEGVEPTNNHAERGLRRGVLWRKISFGCHSADGCRFVERMLTVTQTLRLQDRNILHFLIEAVHNHRANLPIPSLLPVEG